MSNGWSTWAFGSSPSTSQLVASGALAVAETDEKLLAVVSEVGIDRAAD
jgi:hypothetical protein